MPPLDVHLKNSKERTGKDYEELHIWIDDKMNSPTVHDVSRIPDNMNLIRERWGEEACKEFLLHIRDDLEHRVREAFQYFGLMK